MSEYWPPVVLSVGNSVAKYPTIGNDSGVPAHQHHCDTSRMLHPSLLAQLRADHDPLTANIREDLKQYCQLYHCNNLNDKMYSQFTIAGGQECGSKLCLRLLLIFTTYHLPGVLHYSYFIQFNSFNTALICNLSIYPQ